MCIICSDDGRSWKSLLLLLMPSEMLLFIFLYKYYNLDFWKLSCDVSFGKKISTCTVSLHCTEINSHIGLEMFKLFFPFVQG